MIEWNGSRNTLGSVSTTRKEPKTPAMNCPARPYTGPAQATTDPKANILHVSECGAPATPTAKPWKGHVT